MTALKQYFALAFIMLKKAALLFTCKTLNETLTYVHLNES